MTQKRLNVLAMHERVLDFLNAHASIWNAFPPLATQLLTLQDTITDRRDALVQQQVRTEGATDLKQNAYQSAIDTVLRITRFANSYALANYDTDLYAQTKRSRGYLFNLPDDQLLAVLTQMLDAVDAKVAALAPYGITAADLTHARAEVATSQVLRNAARSAIDARKTAGSGIEAAERTGRQALQVMDKAIHYFESSHPQFVTGYRNARMIVNEGVRHTGTKTASNKGPTPPVA